MPQFLFVACQAGAEKALKQDLATHHPELAFAFSRPGFVTFKIDDERFDAQQPLQSPFARTWGSSVGSIREVEDLEKIVAIFPDKAWKHLHIWKRDPHVPGDRQYEPFHLPESVELGQRIRESVDGGPLKDAAINRTARNGDLVADLILVEPEHWFVGWHKASAIATRWPGGVPPIRRPDDMVSRAHLKIQEALRWSRIPLAEGDVCVELGSSPGGSVQCLLEKGLRVIGIDPAIMDERVLNHANFTHVRARAADLKRKEFAGVRWLFADANIAPDNTLEAVEHIVTNRRVSIEGMLLTLKLLDWEMAGQLDDYLQRIREWGYRHVRCRQLAFNRREVCVFAIRNKARLKFR